MAGERKADAVIALGDFGGFGPHPDRALDLPAPCGRPCPPRQLRGIAGRRRRGLRVRVHRSPRQPLRADLLRLHAGADVARAHALDGLPARPHPPDRGRPPRVVLPRLAAAGERVPVGEHHPASLRGAPAAGARRRRRGLHAHRPALEPARRRRARDRERGRAGPPRQRRPDLRVAGDADRRGRPARRRARARRLRPRAARRGDARRGPARRVRGDDRAPAGGRRAWRSCPPGSAPAAGTRTRLAAEVVAAVALAAATFHPVCNLVFRCGCAWFFAGGAAHCDVNDPAPPNCPPCSDALAGAAFSAVLVLGWPRAACAPRGVSRARFDAKRRGRV